MTQQWHTVWMLNRGTNQHSTHPEAFCGRQVIDPVIQQHHIAKRRCTNAL